MISNHNENFGAEIHRILTKAQHDDFCPPKCQMTILNRENRTIFQSEITWDGGKDWTWNPNYPTIEEMGPGPFAARLTTENNREYFSTFLLQDATLQRHSEGLKTASAS